MNAGPQLLLELPEIAPRIRTVKSALSLPRAKRRGPVSSKLAAEELAGSAPLENQLETVLAVVRKYPHHTSLELSVKSGVDRYILGRRLPELRTIGLVKSSTNVYQCTVGRRPAHRWSAL